VKPAIGIAPTLAYLYIVGCVNTSAYAANPGDDIVFALDVTNCPSGTHTVSTSVYWTDAYGASHGYGFETNYVFADNDAPEITLYYAQPTATRADAATMTPTYVQVHCVDGTSAVLHAYVTKADGTKVRDVDPDPSYTCSADNTNTQYPALQWDGADGSGAFLPDGDYTLHVTAKDPAGHEATPLTATVYVDRRTPVIQQSPTPNGGVTGLIDIVLQPAPATTLKQSILYLHGDSGCTYSQYYTYLDPDPSDGGLHYANYDTSQCSPGPHSLDEYVYWVDPHNPNNSFSYRHAVTFDVIDNSPRLELTSPSYDNQTVTLSTPTTRQPVTEGFRCYNGHPVTVSVSIANTAGQTV
jgi:hypothetical protein